VNPIIPDNEYDVMKPQNERYCCNCARKGHDSLRCKKRHWSQHFLNPPYVSSYSGPNYFPQQPNLPENGDNLYHSTPNSNRRFQQSEIDFVSDDIDLNAMYYFGSSSQNKNVQVKQNTSQFNAAQPKEDLTVRVRSREIEEGECKQILGNFVLTCAVPDKNESNDLKHWKTLLAFLHQMELDMPIDFLLKEIDKKIFINFFSLVSVLSSIKSLVSQYIQRNNSERSFMYLPWNRNASTILSHLSSKINEMKNLIDCPLQLFEVTKQLNKELLQDNKLKVHVRSSLLDKLFLCQQKLLMILYREGFADNSYKRLLKIKDNISKFRKRAGNLNALISFNCLFKYLYHYNNVFTPYNPKNLPLLISKYKERIEQCERIAKNPLVFPPQPTMTNKDRISNTAAGESSSLITIQKHEMPSTISKNAPKTQIPPVPPLNNSSNNLPVSDVLPTTSLDNSQKPKNKKRKKKKKTMKFDTAHDCQQKKQKCE
jgi:hypothetical protein